MESILLTVLFAPFVCALFGYFVGKGYEKVRDVLVWVFLVLEFFGMGYLTYKVCFHNALIEINLSGLCQMGLSFTLEGFRAIYGLIACFMWMMTGIFSKDYFKHYKNTNRYYLFFLLTLGATLGVFLSADLYTTFVFFEIMSFTSYVWVAQDEKEESLRAAKTYLSVAVIGGMVMLFGLFLLKNTLNTLEIAKLMECADACEDKLKLYIAGGCILVGFGAKAGVFPLHIWLPKAHPVAPAPASALLSGMLTKSGIFGIIVITANIFVDDYSWSYLLLVLGLITMVWGACLALLSVNLKRTLACSSMSQIGFILVGIASMGILSHERYEAAHGLFLHMVNHSLIKLVLFMVAGVIYMNIHKLDLNEIRGYGRKKPFLNIVFLLGALSIGGIPFLGSGYISKTLLHEGLLAFKNDIVEWIFLISGGCTIAYMTKLYIAIFVEKNEDAKVQKKYDEQKAYLSIPSYLVLFVSAVILPVMGLFPQQIMERLSGYAVSFMHVAGKKGIHYFSMECLKGAAISMVIGVLLYVFVVRLLLMKNKQYRNIVPTWFDLENSFYRPVLLTIIPNVLGFFCRILDSLVDSIVVLLRRSVYRDCKIKQELLEGNRFTVFLGEGLNKLNAFANMTWRRKHPKKKDYVHSMALVSENISDTIELVSRSLSYGLLLFGLGLFVTIGYLLFFAN